MRAKKEIKHDLYTCSKIADIAHIEMTYEIRTSPDRGRLVHFGCAACRKCGVGTQISPGMTKLDWTRCVHPLSPKP